MPSFRPPTARIQRRPGSRARRSVLGGLAQGHVHAQADLQQPPMVLVDRYHLRSGSQSDAWFRRQARPCSRSLMEGQRSVAGQRSGVALACRRMPPGGRPLYHQCILIRVGVVCPRPPRRLLNHHTDLPIRPG
jgi:hypothetical protein